MEHLKAFLARPSHPPDVLGIHALRGLMFAMASAPKVVPIHEWLAIGLNDALSGLVRDAQSQAITDELRDLFMDIDASVTRGTVALPPDCPIAADPMANLDSASALSQWAQGVFIGHNFVATQWMGVLKVLLKEDPATAKAVARATMHLMFFSARHVATSMHEQWETGTLEELAAQASQEYEAGMVIYAEVGRRFRARPAHQWDPAALFSPPPGARRPSGSGKTVGRNDPCTCGSGKKYKKCCGAVH